MHRASPAQLLAYKRNHYSKMWHKLCQQTHGKFPYEERGWDALGDFGPGELLCPEPPWHRSTTACGTTAPAASRALVGHRGHAALLPSGSGNPGARAVCCVCAVCCVPRGESAVRCDPARCRPPRAQSKGQGAGSRRCAWSSQSPRAELIFIPADQHAFMPTSVLFKNCAG